MGTNGHPVLARSAMVAVAVLLMLGWWLAAPAHGGPFVAPQGVSLAAPEPPAIPGVGARYVPPAAFPLGPATPSAVTNEWIVDICRVGHGQWTVSDPVVIADRPGADRITFRLCLNFAPPPGGAPLAAQGADDWAVHVVFGATPWWGAGPGSFTLSRSAPLAHTVVNSGSLAPAAYGFQLVLVRSGVIVDQLDPTLVTGVRGLEATVDGARFSEHFKCYEVADTPFRGRTMTIADQFGERRSRVSRAQTLCNPVRKNSEPFSQRSAHLVCHGLSDARKEPARTTLVSDQFGTVTVVLQRPDRLCVPSLKRRLTAARVVAPRGRDPALALDHFRCYRVQEQPVTREVLLADQFERKRTAVLRLVRLCAPASKNREGARQPQAHLSCYAIRDAAGQPTFRAQQAAVRNQFGVSVLRATKAETLCVPAQKLEPFPPPEIDPPPPPGPFFGARCRPNKQLIPHGGNAAMSIVARPGSAPILSVGPASSQPTDTPSYRIARNAPRRFTFTSKKIDPPHRTEQYILRFRVRFGRSARTVIASIVVKCVVFVVHDEPPQELVPPPQPEPTPTPTPVRRRLTVSVGGGGRVTSQPAGIDCPSTCDSFFDVFTRVELTPVVPQGFRFGGWTGACSGNGACRVEMSEDRTVGATFVRVFNLTVAIPGGGGSVTSNPAGIGCGVAGGSCQATFDENTVVTLAPQAEAGRRFGGWSGDCTGNGACQVTMSQARNVQATFTAVVTLTIDFQGDGSGAVVAQPPGGMQGRCTADCEFDYPPNTAVTLFAQADPGSTFGPWGGACAGQMGNSCNLQPLTQDTTVVAPFAAARRSLFALPFAAPMLGRVVHPTASMFSRT